MKKKQSYTSLFNEKYAKYGMTARGQYDPLKAQLGVTAPEKQTPFTSQQMFGYNADSTQDQSSPHGLLGDQYLPNGQPMDFAGQQSLQGTEEPTAQSVSTGAPGPKIGAAGFIGAAAGAVGGAVSSAFSMIPQIAKFLPDQQSENTIRPKDRYANNQYSFGQPNVYRKGGRVCNYEYNQPKAKNGMQVIYDWNGMEPVTMDTYSPVPQLEPIAPVQSVQPRYVDWEYLQRGNQMLISPIAHGYSPYEKKQLTASLPDTYDGYPVFKGEDWLNMQPSDSHSYIPYTPAKRAESGIHIKPENRGKFTESAKRAGMGVQEYASHILANKDEYSSTLVKRANFARNASKWNKAPYGNTIQPVSYNPMFPSPDYSRIPTQSPTAMDTADYNRNYYAVYRGDQPFVGSDPAIVQQAYSQAYTDYANTPTGYQVGYNDILKSWLMQTNPKLAQKYIPKKTFGDTIAQEAELSPWEIQDLMARGYQVEYL